MGDSERPKLIAPEFEVPDLELDLPTVGRRAKTAFEVPVSAYSGARLFDLDAFTSGSNVDLTSTESAAAKDASDDWPSGRAPERAGLALDPVQIAMLADYGDLPRSIHTTPWYAYRVFIRQRRLKLALRELELERAHAEGERTRVLAELTRTLRPEFEKNPSFSGLLTDLSVIEQRTEQHDQALSSVNSELGRLTLELDAEGVAEGARAKADELAARAARAERDERAHLARRADAQLKRVQIEIRALASVAERQQAPTISVALETLQLRADALLPELNQAKFALQQAELCVSEIEARVHATRKRALHLTRKKQALAQHFKPEIESRGLGLRESVEQQERELAQLACSVLSLAGAVHVPAPWLSRVKVASKRADDLLLSCQLHLRALDAYDHERVLQGVRIACTAIALLAFLLVLKLAL